jgi:glycosyltransferase involved in cell wall biosynthesis
MLVEELVRRGHEVTLCASGDSRTSARLHSVYGRSLRTAEDLTDRAPYDWVHIATALEQASGFDLVHNHAGELAMAMGRLVDVPMLTTLHCQITPDTRFVWDRYHGWYNTISHAQRATMPPVNGGRLAGVVHNAIDVESFPFSREKSDYLLFLSRIAPEKGAHLAVEVAARVGLRLVIAGKVDRVDREYFAERVQPLIDGHSVFFAGEANAGTKRVLYEHARCLLLPLQWDEPFGLVMAEAMACGTPVITINRGAAAEIVEDGKTGFLADDIDGMVAAVRRLREIDPSYCREHVRRNFAPELMAGRYLAIYERIMAERRPEASTPVRAGRVAVSTPEGE